MDYSKFGIEDFLSDLSFREYCLGNDDISVDFWTLWLREHPEKAEVINAARSLYYVLNGGITDRGFHADLEIFRKAFGYQASAGDTLVQLPSSLPASKRKPNLKWLVVVSGIAACMFITFGISLYTVKSTNDEMVYINPAGKKLSLKLADGTKVFLNGSSTLTIAKDYNKNKRYVMLDGEGYFVVVHNRLKPFIIHTNKITVKDIGTEFNLKAYLNDKKTEATLIKGAIEIKLNEIDLSNKLKKGLILTPNKKFVLLNNSPAVSNSAKKISPEKLFKITNVAPNTVRNNAIVETDWVQNKLSFFDEPLDEMAVEMERWYGVKVNISNSATRTSRFTASFNGENIDVVLEALRISGNFNYRREGDVITIY